MASILTAKTQKEQNSSNNKEESNTNNKKEIPSYFTVAFYAIGWLILIISLNFMNKLVFKYTPFKYPVLLSTVHMIVNYLCTLLVINKSVKQNTNQTISGSSLEKLIAIFSILFVLNIAFGNMSVKVVNLLLSQVFRSSMPIFIMITSILLHVGKPPSLQIVLSVLPIIVGVYFACLPNDSGSNSKATQHHHDGGDDEEHFISLKSLLILFAGNVLCSLKTTLTNKYLNQYNLHPMLLLNRLSFYSSFLMFLFAYLIGEVTDLIQNDFIYDLKTIGFISSTGLIAFLLNYFNFKANVSTSPLTMSIVGLVQQVLTVYFSTIIFNTPLGIINVIGIVLTVLGSCLYTFIKFREQQQLNKKIK
ncbi:hypothetical protein ABK040_008786 [Willaertia magna]